MWRIWLLFDPRRILIGLATFLFAMALLIHFIMLSTDKYNWIDGPNTRPVSSSQFAPVADPVQVPTRLS